MCMEAMTGSLESTHQLFDMVLNRTPQERLDWKPAMPGGDPTSVLEVVRHLIAGEGDMRSIVAEGKMPEMESAPSADWSASSEFARHGPAAGVSDLEGLKQLIADERKKTAEAIRGVPPNAWGDVIETPFMTATRQTFLDIFVQHWAYHAGQISYVQRLYGDLGFG